MAAVERGADLFAAEGERERAANAPLAARMRPRTLDEFVGQDHIVGPGRLLRRAIAADQLSSLIFYGPPGTGKTTLAEVIAGTTRARFVSLNAVLAGVKDLREAIAAAREAGELHGQRTILFVDEVHRWNKAQQDALLPSVENGTTILIGATTENPYFEVIKPLVSRSRIFQLRPLQSDDLQRVAAAALTDQTRGLGSFRPAVDEDALDHLVDVANGDARSLLNALELAVTTTPPRADGHVRVTRAVAEESIQKRAVLYDKEGDAHYDTISAFIKSVRGSDPDAALYWLARMVYAGEDPRFLFRRMLVLAAEDVGLADPAAVGVVAGCAAAYDYVGLPEGRFHLSQAALYLSTAPKSNTTMAFFDALRAVEEEQEHDVPGHLKDGNRDAEGFGHGQGYLYPHAYDSHWVAQQYLPSALQGRVFYQPSAEGQEATVGQRVHRQREASLAAAFEAEAGVARGAAPAAGSDRQIDHWLQRSVGAQPQRLAAERDALVERAALSRHHVVLDLNLGAGLVTLELLRRCGDGGVWSLTSTEAGTELAEHLRGLPALSRPTLHGDTGALVEEAAAAGVHFDRIVGRHLANTDGLAVALERRAAGGRVVVCQAQPHLSPRLHSLFPSLADEVRAAVEEAELAAIADREALTVPDLRRFLERNVGAVEATEHRLDSALTIDTGLVDRLFASSEGAYRAVLANAGVAGADVTRLRRSLAGRQGQTVGWSWHFVLLSAGG